jgi:hypothetical protein
MGIVGAQRLNDYLSNPAWSSGQWAEAERVCQQKEARLSSLLGGVPLDPVSYAETVAVLDSGLVATRYPLTRVDSLNDVAVDDTHPLPDGWVIQNNRLRAVTADVGLVSAVGLLTPSFGLDRRVQGSGAVKVSYQAGWGPAPALVDTILTKASAVFLNRHDDTVVVRDLDATAPPKLKEDWTTEEINRDLGVYRLITAWR